MTRIDTGIASIGLDLPPLAMPVEELALLRGVDPDKYRIGLGCSELSLCPPEFSIVDLASEAARRARMRVTHEPETMQSAAVARKEMSRAARMRLPYPPPPEIQNPGAGLIRWASSGDPPAA